MRNLPIALPRKMICSDSPSLGDIRRSMGLPVAIGIATKLLVWLARMVNVDRNLNEIQIAELANDLVYTYDYLKPEEIKFLFKRTLRTKKIYACLDYNMVMCWIEEYDAERCEMAIDISNQAETQSANDIPKNGDEIGYDEYLAQLRQRSENGDDTAIQILTTIEDLEKVKHNDHEKEKAFKEWKFKYLASKYRNHK